ncbi:hypothetical protein A2U01_0076979, partial [Trifolium medium]|nr:hypothetical protein [Trifolium medium]
KEYWDLIETGVVVAPANATPAQLAAANESRLKDLKKYLGIYENEVLGINQSQESSIAIFATRF